MLSRARRCAPNRSVPERRAHEPYRVAPPIIPSLAVTPALASGAVRAEESVGLIETRQFDTTDFRLQSGAVLPEMTIAYETYGRLAPDGRNAVLLTHGFTSSQHMAGRSGANGAEGSWDGLVGPGKAIDTDKLFVVASNMLRTGMSI